MTDTLSTKWFYDYVAALHQAKDKDHLFDVFLKVLKQFEIERVMYGFNPLLPRNSNITVLQPALLLSNYPEELIQLYNEGNGVEDDISLVDAYYSQSNEYLWSNAHLAYDNDAMTKGQRLLHECTSDYGVDFGVTLSFGFFDPQPFGAMGICADHVKCQDEFERQWLQYGEQIKAAAQQFHMHVAKLPIGVGFKRLSPRQLEAMQWAAEGLLYERIAEKMKITVSTVDRHLYDARCKLDANTNAEAVHKLHVYNLMR